MSAKKLNIGDYVRTKGGLIGKVIEIKGNSKTYFIPNRQENDVIEIIKSSPNIIDLIEVGDYVNGAKVVRVKTDENGTKWVYTNNENAYGYKSNEIKSIITYEQFKAMEYKL